jgi:ribosomal protein L16 Arg81 hydroxylase
LSESWSDVLVVGRNSLIALPIPETLTEVRELMSQGVGLVVRQAERHDAGLSNLAEVFSHDIPGEVHIQLFVTPGGTYGFGWHYDDEDVFIAQTAGTKDYFLRENTVEHYRRGSTAADFTRFAE